MKRSLLTIALAAVAVAVSSAPASGQLVNLRGQVVDATTGRPVYGASVRTTGRGAGFVTDTAGMFVLQLWTLEEYPLTVSQLGYQPRVLVLPASAAEDFTTIHLAPDPIALEGLQVLVDRFEQRRHFYTGSVSTIELEDFMRAPAMSAYDLLLASLPSGSACGRQICSVRRGRRMRVRICIDDDPAYEPINDMERLSAGDLYLMEIFERGQDVRVYTRSYVDDVLGTGKNLAPIEFGCGDIRG